MFTLINLSLCFIITKYWIQSFRQVFFFQLGPFNFLEIINRRPYLSELTHLSFGVKSVILKMMKNFFTVYL